MAWAAAWVIAIPCVAGALAFALRGALRGLFIALGVAGATAAAAALVVFVARDGARDLALGGWLAPLGIRLRADGLSAFFIALQAGVGAIVSGYAAGYFAGDREGKAFWPLWLTLWAGLCGLYLTGDLFNAYVALELIGVTAVGLVAASGGAALVAGLRYLIVTLTGSLLYLAGVALVYAEIGAVDMEAAAQGLGPSPVAHVALALMAAGLLLKTAVFPMHFWLPPAHANAAAPASAILSGLVIKGSFYLLVRIWNDVFSAHADDMLAELMGVLGVAAVIWGSAQAIVAARVKMLVAYSTVAQVGYLLMAFPLGGDAWPGAMYFAAAHGLAKAAMFAVAGAIARELGHDDIAKLGGAAGTLPAGFFAFALAGVSLIGLPPSGGFLGKWLLLSAAADHDHMLYLAAIPAGTLMAAGYVFRVIAPALAELRRAPRPSPWRLWREAPPLVLALAALALGFSLSPALVLLSRGAPFGGGG